MNRFCIIFLFVLIGGAEFSYAQKTEIRYKDSLWLHLRPVDINDDIFMNLNPNVIYFDDAQTCDYLCRIFRRKQQDQERLDTNLLAPEVHRQITVYQSNSPNYRLSYDTYRMALNGNPVQFDFFLQHLFEKIIELNQEDSVLHIQESISEYHRENRYPMIEALVQEMFDKDFPKENLTIDIGLGHRVRGQINIITHVHYPSGTSVNPEIKSVQIVNIDTCEQGIGSICNCYRLYPMYKGPLVMKWKDYLLMANKYPLHIISSSYSKKDNDAILTLSPPSIVVTQFMLNAILLEIEELMTPFFFIIPSCEDISLPAPEHIEYHLSLPCQFF